VHSGHKKSAEIALHFQLHTLDGLFVRAATSQWLTTTPTSTAHSTPYRPTQLATEPPTQRPFACCQVPEASAWYSLHTFGAASFKFNGLCIRKLNILLVLSQALRSSLCQSVQPFSVCFQFNSLRRNAKKRYFRRMHLWRKPFKFPFHFGLSLSHTLRNAERMSNIKLDFKPLYEFSLSSYIAF